MVRPMAQKVASADRPRLVQRPFMRHVRDANYGRVEADQVLAVSYSVRVMAREAGRALHYDVKIMFLKRLVAENASPVMAHIA